MDRGSASTVQRLKANAALRAVLRRDIGETHRAILTRMAKESVVGTPTIVDLVRLDRNRKGKNVSNAYVRGIAISTIPQERPPRPMRAI